MTRTERHVQSGLPVRRLGETKSLNNVELNNLFSVFPCRSIIYEECGHGKRMLITFELSILPFRRGGLMVSVLDPGSSGPGSSSGRGHCVVFLCKDT